MSLHTRKTPKGSYIDQHAIITGDVVLGKRVYICALATIRGDEGKIVIGDDSNVQEHVAIHGSGMEIGKRVTIGHGAVVHGRRVGDDVLIGMNSTILHEVVVGNKCIIGAGAVVKEGAIIPPNSLVVGVPAKVVRELTQKDKDLISEAWKNYACKIPK